MKFKTCSRCKTKKLVDQFKQHESSRDGYDHYCMQCRVEYERDRWYNNPANVVKRKEKERQKRLGVKTCPKCKTEKPLDKFGENKARADGLTCWCKQCKGGANKKYQEQNREKVNARSRASYWRHREKRLAKNKKWREENKELISKQRKEWREENPERVKELWQQWYEDNKEYNSERYKQWYEENKEHRLEYTKQWREENEDRVKKRMREYREKNRERIRANKRRAYHQNPHYQIELNHRRRAQKQKNGGSYTQEEWEALCAKYDYKCLACGKKKKLTADHVIPLSEGGTNDINNIQPLCKSCNSKKWTSTTDYRY